MSLEDAKSELDRLLGQSVREHLMSDVPLGVWLSGGVDSTTILHYAAEASNSKLRTFSISFNGYSFDESSSIAEVVKQYGTEHEQLDLNPEQDLEGAIRELSYYSDEPSADSGALPVWFLSRLCKTRCTVAFSGEGADEVFGGYLTYRANRIAQRLRQVPAGAIRLALRALSAWPASDEKISLEYKVKRMLEGSLLPADQAHIYWNGTFSETEKAALLKVPLPSAMLDVLSPLRSRIPGDGVAPFLEFDQSYYLPDDILVKSDRISMAHSVEVRPPFLDHRVIEFAATIPTELKIHGDRQKVVLKELMRPKLRSSITQRKKVGFDIPTHEWFRGPLRGLLMETLEVAQAEHADVFNFDAIDKLAKSHMNRNINVGYHLWGLMTLFLWMKRWNVQSSPIHQSSKSGAHDRMTNRRQIFLIVVLFAAAVYLGCIVSPPSLMDDVDAVQAQIARNMLSSGDWVTARLDGVPYLEKPPLLYWMIAISYKIFGVHDWSARIPVALSAIGLCWTTAAFGLWAFGKRAGFYAGLCMSTCIGLFLFTRILIPDAR